ncbi:glycosyltransferase family 4 protein [Methylotetracoccus oryzae]|uniref:glycosyltransferase family 4 protein n=1 Tax=Methylotetracoccus oryzae TaxID=1919059 RepID=UPI00111B4C50|nr:glycosyltransferase family 1 protein [Methylotetracoccus oryzae]
MRITLISDAWHPQINGIVTALVELTRALTRLGHTVTVITPEPFRTWPCPGYPDVRLAFLCGHRLRPLIDASQPDAIHLMTEGPVGFAARRYCRHRRWPYTSSFHSHFPEYLKLRAGIPLPVSYGYLRWFHRKSERVLVGTASLAEQLARKGFRRLATWPLGVDTEQFRPQGKEGIVAPRPVFMYLGRIAVEKAVEDFLRLDLPGSKVVIGDGPQRPELETRYPEARFLGYRRDQDLARCLAAADVLVFPSRTDTFGLAMLEALACGVPVAAYPVQGPRDIIRDARVGRLHTDLRRAALDALNLDPEECRRYALDWSWEASARRFVDRLALLQPTRSG